MALAIAIAATTADANPRSEARRHDPVVFDTSLLAALPDRDPGNYRLYAARAGVVRPVPFQVDARERNGRYVVAGTVAGVGQPFDGDDELVFMAKDLGERAEPAALPGGAAGLEIEVADADTGERGFAYLVHAPSAPSPDVAPYAAYDPARNEVAAVRYRLRYPPGRNFLTGLSVTGAAGGDDRPLIDRLSMRIEPTFSLLLTQWSPLLTEDSFHTVIHGVRNGPVRAIVRARQSLDLGRLLPDAPAGDVATFYYAGAIVTPSTFRVPALVLQMLRAFRFEGKAILDPEAGSCRYVDAANPDGVALVAGADGLAPEIDPDWFVIDGPSGTYLHALTIPEQWRAWGITRGAVVRTMPDGRLAAGYSLLDMTRLRKGGAYDLRTAMVVLDRPYRPGDAESALAMLYRPLAVQVRPLAPAAP